MDKKPDYQIIKKPSLVDKIIQLVQRRVARSRYQRDLELVARTEENDEAIKPTFYRGYNAQIGQAIVQELGQNPNFTSNISNGFIPQNQQIEYIKSNGGSSGNFIPTTRQKQIRRERVRRIIIDLFNFKTAQILFMADENWNHIKSELIKSGDNQDIVLETIENTYMVGFVNYSSDPDDYLIIIRQSNNYFGFNSQGEQWHIPKQLIYIGGELLNGGYYLETPSFNSLFNTYFTNGNQELSDVSENETVIIGGSPYTYLKHRLRTNISTCSSDYSTYNQNSSYELDRTYPYTELYKNTSMNWYTTIDYIKHGEYTEYLDLALDSESNNGFYYQGNNLNINPEFSWIKSKNDNLTLTRNTIRRGFTLEGGSPFSDWYEDTDNRITAYSETRSQTVWVDKNRNFKTYQTALDVNLNSLYIIEYQNENSLAEPVEKFYRYKDIQVSLDFTHKQPITDYSIHYVRRDNNISLYSTYTNWSGSVSIFYPSILIDITGLADDKSESQLNSLRIVTSQNNQYNIINNIEWVEHLENGNRVININSYRPYSLSEYIRFYIGDTELNIENTYLFYAKNNSVVIPDELPYSFTVPVWTNLCSSLARIDTIGELQREETFSYNNPVPALSFSDNPPQLPAPISPTFLIRETTPIKETVTREVNLWNNLANESECYVLQKNDETGEVALYEGVFNASFTYFETEQNKTIYTYNYTNNTSTTENIPLGWSDREVNFSSINATVTIARLIHKFIGFPVNYKTTIISKANLLAFLYSNGFNDKLNWTEDNLMFLSCANDYNFNNEDNTDTKLAEIFPMQFDGENIVFREDLLMKKPATVSVPPTPTSENWYYYDTGYILYNYDS
jgi:hypothetical protein